MADFITNGASELPSVKQNARVPRGAVTEWSADDANDLRQAALDLRTEIINVVQTGTGAGSATPVMANNTGRNFTLGEWMGILEDTRTRIINVKDHGALGNGSTDDTAAIQDAINTVVYQGLYGGEVYFPPGIYVIDGHLDLTYGIGITLTGASTTLTQLKKLPGASQSDYILKVKGISHRIRGLRLQGEADPTTTSGYSANMGIYVVAYPMANEGNGPTRACAFDDIEIDRVGVGIQMGNWTLDGANPDIALNPFRNIYIHDVNVGIIQDGQNVLLNPFHVLTIGAYRDYAVNQIHDGQFTCYDSFLGICQDYLTSSYPVHTNPKINIQGGYCAILRSRNEDAGGNQRTCISFTSSAANLTLRDNIIAHESGHALRSIYVRPGGAGGRINISGNYTDGYLEIGNADANVFGNTFTGTGIGVVGGVLRMAEQAGMKESWGSNSTNEGGYFSTLRVGMNQVGTALTGILQGGREWDPGNVGAGSYATADVTVTGVALGNVTIPTCYDALPAGIILTALVTGDNTVRLTVQNNTLNPVVVGNHVFDTLTFKF